MVSGRSPPGSSSSGAKSDIDNGTMHPENHSLHTPRVDSKTRERGRNEDVANPGFVRPPFVYLAAILVGAGLHLVRPLRWLPDGIGVWVGVPLVLFSLAIFFASTRQFKAAGTPVPGNMPTTAIVESGLYRLSRNPIYLAFSGLVFGIAAGSTASGYLPHLPYP